MFIYLSLRGGRHISPSTPGNAADANKDLDPAWLQHRGSPMEEEKTRDWEEDTIIGAESTGRPGEVALIIGNVESCGMSTGELAVRDRGV